MTSEEESYGGGGKSIVVCVVVSKKHFVYTGTIDTMLHLPEEVVFHVMSFLDYHTVSYIMCLSKSWR